MRWPGGSREGGNTGKGREGKSAVTQKRNKKELENKKEKGRKQTRGTVSAPTVELVSHCHRPPQPQENLVPII